MVEFRSLAAAPSLQPLFHLDRMPLPFLVTQALLTVPLAVFKSVVEKADVRLKVLTTQNRESGWRFRGRSGVCHPQLRLLPWV